MKIGKIENNIIIPSIRYSKYSFLFKMKIGESVLAKLEKKENIHKMASNISSAIKWIQNGKYEYQKKGKKFSRRLVYKNQNPIGIRIWRIK